MPSANPSKSQQTNGAASPSDLDPLQIRQLQHKLPAWFRRHQRDLPWRHSRDPYRIWVSEVMLQQTQVVTVIPFYHRFLAAFPDVAALAAAREGQVLRLWEGLGYYRRARGLHRAAQQLVREHGGRVPDDADVLRSLPGIGRYTAGAVLSQAFDRRWPLVDANVARVFSRWFAWDDDLRAARSQAWLWQTAEAILPRNGVGDWNQALMELGALVCTPRTPACGECPVRRHCAAHQQSLEAVIPRKGAPPKTVLVREVAVVLNRRGRVLLLQRPPDAERWAGMWEFPHGERRKGESSALAATRLAQELTGLAVKLGKRLITIKHGVTRFAIRMDCFAAEPASGRVRPTFHTVGRWFTLSEVAQMPLATPQRTLSTIAFDNRHSDAG